MKKYAIIGLALMVCSLSFAQKKEIKTADKAIKSSNFADAKIALQSAEALVSSMDGKTKAKFYFLKGQALYANGAGNNSEVNEALKSFKALTDMEAKSGKVVYTPQVDEIKLNMSNAFIQKASDALEQKQYDKSAINFERAYRVSTADTLYLFNSATVAVMGKSYELALKLYDELLDMGYTGIAEEYFATEIETGEEQSFSNETIRSLSIKGGTHNNERNAKSESRVGEMAKNVALIYVELGDNDKAIAAIERAKETSPNDFNLLVSEANIQYKIGNKARYKELIAEALSINPDNVDLYFNLGVISAEDKDFEAAKGYYNKAMEIDPNYINAKMNMVALILDEEQGIIDKMNNLGSSAADDKKYGELKESRQQLYRDAIPYLTETLEIEPDNLSAVKTLMNIYSAIGDEDNYKSMKAKADTLENN
jgi:tetratricopeptide (TPR) repeat protein